MTIILPNHGRRAWVRAFSATAGLGIAIATAVAVRLGLQWTVALCVVLPVAAGVGATLRPREAAVAYRLWNLMARAYARVARAVLLALCYMVLFTVVGIAGSSVRLQRPRAGESLWFPRSTLATSTYWSQSEQPDRPWSHHRWIGMFVWAFRSGNSWAVLLIPFLMLVAVLEHGEEQRFPAGIYTLF
jgi:hypothetical protein